MKYFQEVAREMVSLLCPYIYIVDEVNVEALSQQKWGTLQAKRCDLAIEGEE